MREDMAGRGMSAAEMAEARRCLRTLPARCRDAPCVRGAQVAAAIGDAADEEGDVDPDAMTYEQLLELGAALGDVRAERWRAAAAGHIGALATMAVPAGGGGVGGGARGESARMCHVCQCEYEEGEEVKLLPCRHAYHAGACARARARARALEQ